MNYSLSQRSVLSAPLFLLLSGCGAADPAAPTEVGEASVPVADYGEGVVVATLKPSAQQTIQVVEYPDGLMGIAEWHGPEFDPTTPLAMAHFRGRTLAEFYERVAGEALDVKVLDHLLVNSETQDLAAPGLPEPIELEAPAIHTRALDCARDPVDYTRYASGWGSEYCSAPPGWEDAWCKTNEPTITKDWTHGERWMLQIQNMSLCNTAKILVKRQKETWSSVTTRYLLNDTPVGPNAGGMFWWEISSRDWRWYTKFSHLSGNEQSHLNLANYRQW